MCKSHLISWWTRNREAARDPFPSNLLLPARRIEDKITNKVSRTSKREPSLQYLVLWTHHIQTITPQGLSPGVTPHLKHNTRACHQGTPHLNHNIHGLSPGVTLHSNHNTQACHQGDKPHSNRNTQGLPPGDKPHSNHNTQGLSPGDTTFKPSHPQPATGQEIMASGDRLHRTKRTFFHYE